MYFSTLHDFIAMGGYAVYVWPAYGIATVVLIGIFIHSWWKSKHASRT